MSSSSQDLRSAIFAWRRGLAARLWLRQMLRLTAGYLFIWGAASLLLRVMWDVNRVPLLAGAAGLLVMAAIAAMQARRRVPPTEAVAALFDVHSQAGGLYLADAQAAGWQDRLPLPRRPAVRWRATREGGLLLAAMVFLALALATPRWVTRQVQARPLDVAGDVAQLQAQIHTLQEERVLPADQARELDRKLDQVRQDADGRDPVKTWESLDHVRSRVNDAAAQAVEQAVNQAQQMTQARQLADALDKHAAALQPDQLAQAMQTLQAMARQAARDNDALAKALEQQGVDLAAPALSQAQLAALAQSLGMTTEQLMTQLQGLCEAGLCDGKSLGQVMGMVQSRAAGAESLAKALAEHMDELAVQDILVMLGQPGAGGVNRGPGDAPMTWNDAPSSAEGARFEDQVLPPAELAAIRDSQRVGLGAAAPQVHKDQPGSTGGVLPARDAAGSGVSQTVLPQHRSAVRKYFERGQ